MGTVPWGGEYFFLLPEVSLGLGGATSGGIQASLCVLRAGLRCCVQAFSSCGERGLLFVTVRQLLIAVASLIAEHRL